MRLLKHRIVSDSNWSNGILDQLMRKDLNVKINESPIDRMMFRLYQVLRNHLALWVNYETLNLLSRSRKTNEKVKSEK
jgi:hypothetical protein